jgi:hypothetical protein
LNEPQTSASVTESKKHSYDGKKLLEIWLLGFGFFTFLSLLK